MFVSNVPQLKVRQHCARTVVAPRVLVCAGAGGFANGRDSRRGDPLADGLGLVCRERQRFAVGPGVHQRPLAAEGPSCACHTVQGNLSGGRVSARKSQRIFWSHKHSCASLSFVCAPS